MTAFVHAKIGDCNYHPKRPFQFEVTLPYEIGLHSPSVVQLHQVYIGSLPDNVAASDTLLLLLDGVRPSQVNVQKQLQSAVLSFHKPTGGSGSLADSQPMQLLTPFRPTSVLKLSLINCSGEPIDLSKSTLSFLICFA
ncbi:MAG: hypothetical protein GY820_01945 [Gammaproteobacteria bacterium]|nr:hypothetical protein [Gammaproteobacteria bacterium]